MFIPESIRPVPFGPEQTINSSNHMYICVNLMDILQVKLRNILCANSQFIQASERGDPSLPDDGGRRNHRQTAVLGQTCVQGNVHYHNI